MITSPPLPPSPPEGPPRGTNFSRRKARQPFPPFPAFTRIFASSMNILRNHYRLGPATGNSPLARLTFRIHPSSSTVAARKQAWTQRKCLAFPTRHRACPTRFRLVPLEKREQLALGGFDRLHHHELSHRPFVEELDAPGDLGKKSVIFAAPDVQPGLYPRASLPNNDRAAG